MSNLNLETIIQTVGIPFVTATEWEESTMGERKLENEINGDLKGDDKLIKRDDIRTATVDLFIFEEGYNIRDNGHAYGIDLDHAEDISFAYDDPNNTIPAVEVIKVMVNGRIMFKVHHGHHRVMGARIKDFRDKQKGESKTFRIKYVVVTGKSALELLFSQFQGNSGLGLTVMDRSAFYFRAIKLGGSITDIAKQAKVTETEVSRYARLYELKDEAKDLIRQGYISPTRARTLMDEYPSMEQVFAAMQVEAESVVITKENGEDSKGSTKKVRKTRSKGVMKPSKKLTSSINSSVSKLTTTLHQSLEIKSLEDFEQSTEGKETIEVSLPIELVKALLQGGSELLGIDKHNEEFKAKVLEKTQEIKAARLH